MREPYFTHCNTPFSKADSGKLQRVASGENTDRTPDDDGEVADLDFCQRYAAILLRERGL